MREPLLKFPNNFSDDPQIHFISFGLCTSLSTARGGGVGGGFGAGGGVGGGVGEAPARRDVPLEAAPPPWRPGAARFPWDGAVDPQAPELLRDAACTLCLFAGAAPTAVSGACPALRLNESGKHSE
mmetsp:Transcript_137505/g.343063  ORF Transcript_137505/g.343063 Transcript_137505/m.343063 type:complete len:126 (+) Transcript_137505:1108-1485(+)